MLMIEGGISAGIAKLRYYKCYVDDMLVFCSSEQLIVQLMQQRNCAHANLLVTCEVEQKNCLPSVDPLISRMDEGLVKRSIYRKATWSGQYLHFNRFTSVRYKRTLVKTLVSRTRRICWAVCLADELELLTTTLLENGYPRSIIEKHSQQLVPKHLLHIASRKKIHIELPFKEDFTLLKPTKLLLCAMQRRYCAAQVVVINRTCNLPVPPTKESQPIGANSHCIYKFVCECGDSYIGRTNRSLTSRIKEHVPRWVQCEIDQLPCPTEVLCLRKPPASSIGKHLLTTRHLIEFGSAFTLVLRHPNSRFLCFAEAVAISRMKLALCVRKQLFISLTAADIGVEIPSYILHLILIWSHP
ncbi:unnamed protein product [Dicrocoelium dendriticum]|nr:unnamed protein product [Dicrocoelium dendriticum]CAH8652912.1 unnamed protein product [Dicrocoelium dendriticum]